MSPDKVYTVIGLMSGTSLDGIDAALIRTDGERRVERLGFISLPYDEEMRAALRRCLGKMEDVDGFIARTALDMTRAHAAAVDWLLSRTGMQPDEIDLIGFHGQTIFHDPARRFTWQIGNSAALARMTGIDVVGDFRLADVAAGGQGAPLMPLYHQALAANLEKPLAVLNIGGVANVTYLGADGSVIAFDTGPGNALLNDWVEKHTGRQFDESGLLARQGRVNNDILAHCLSHPYFLRPPPKSLDRDEFNPPHPSLSPTRGGEGKGEGAADGAATLTALTIGAVTKALDHLPQTPKRWLVTGGGRHNAVMMEGLRAALGVLVEPVEKAGWAGDALEAEGFAYLAARSARGLPLSLPTTTGVPQPQTGGRLYRAESREMVKNK
jgi:anhydro-N-acetylmuramic acid kinase